MFTNLFADLQPKASTCVGPNSDPSLARTSGSGVSWVHAQVHVCPGPGHTASEGLPIVRFHVAYINGLDTVRVTRLGSFW